MFALLTLTSLLAACQNAGAPSRELVDMADLVVLADVTSVSTALAGEAGDGSMPAGSDRVARLQVRETWKGPRLAALDVPFNDFLRFPAPPAYVAGARVVAFLRRDGVEWSTVGMSAGVIAVGESGELEGLRVQVARAVALERKAPGSAPDGAAPTGGGADAAPTD